MEDATVGTFVICEEVDRLAHELAAQWIGSILYSETEEIEVDGETWLDLNSPSSLEFLVIVQFADEIRYAELRNLLRHHPTQPNLVQIVED